MNDTSGTPGESGPDPYGDRDLVELYDLDNPDGADHAYYRALADRLEARRIVDLGCGTGLLTRSLATGGRVVVGVDPSRTMLDYARRQPGADAVRWVLGDAAVLTPDAAADLAICTGNAVMHLDPAGFPAALRALAGVLRPGGSIAFESRNPAARAWESWTRAATYDERDTPIGRLREWMEVTSVADGRVVFDAHNVFADGEERTYTSELYFRSAAEIEAGLTAAGFHRITVHAGWADQPLDAASRLLVVRAEKR